MLYYTGEKRPHSFAIPYPSSRGIYRTVAAKIRPRSEKKINIFRGSHRLRI